MPDTIKAPPAAVEPEPFKWTMQELKHARDEGKLSQEEVHEVYMDLRMQGNMYDLSKEEVRYAATTGRLSLSQVEQYVERKKHPFWWATKDLGKGFATGTKNFIENLSEQTVALQNWATGTDNGDGKFDPRMAPAAPESMGGKFVAGATEFMMAYGGASKALSATGAVRAFMATPKMAKLAASSPKVAAFLQSTLHGTLAGAPADYISFDIKDGRLADLMEEHGVLPQFLNFMTTKDDNPEALERFKNAVEGAFLGSAVEALLLGVKLFKAGLHAKYNGFVDNLKMDIATDPRLSAAQHQSHFADALIAGDALKAAEAAQKAKTMYHGTTANFHGEDISFDGLGPHLTNSPDVAAKFAGDAGTVHTYQPEIKNPLRVEDHKGSHSSATGTIEALVEQGHLPKDYIDDAFHARLNDGLEGLDEVAAAKQFEKNNNAELAKVREILEGKGYDGIVYKNKVEGGGDTIIPFNKNQLKRKPVATEAGATARAFNIMEAMVKGNDPDYAGDVLIKHMESAPDAQEVIKHIYDNSAEIINAQRKPQSHAQTLAKSTKTINDLAKVTGGDPDAIMNNMKNIYGEVKDATEKVHALYRVLETYSDQVSKMAQAYSGDVKDALTLMEHIKQLEELQAMAYGLRSESGRLLNMHNMGIKKSRFDFTEFKGIDDLPSYIQGNRDNFERIIKQFGQMKTMDARLKFSRFLGKGGIMQWLLSYRQAQLLWNPVTHLINTTSQTGALGMRIVSRAVGHGMDALVHLDPERLKAFGAEMAGYLQALKVSFKINPGKVASAHRALRAADPKMSFKDAIVKNPELGTFYRATIGRQGIIDPGVKWQDEVGLSAMLAASPIGKLGRTIDAVLKVPFNALAGVDEVFKTLGTQSEYYSLVYREGLDLSRTGRLAKGIADPDMYFKSEVKKGRPDLFNKALDVGKEVTFQDDLAKSSKKINEALNASNTGLAARMMFIPFYKTTVNLVKYAGRNSPIGILSTKVQENLMKGGVEMWETLTRMSLGAGAMYWAWGQFEEGKITGRLPVDGRAALQAAGVQEYSKYDEDTGKWVSYRRTDPFGLWLAFTADVHLAMDVYAQYQEDDNIDTEITDIWAAGLHAIVSPVIGASWMAGAQDMFTYLADPDRTADGGKKVLMRQAGSLIPGATGIDYATTEFGADEYYRELNNWMDVIYQKFDSGKLLKKRDPIYGHPVKREERWMRSIRQTTMTDDPVKLEIVRRNVKVSKLRDSLEHEGEKVKITPEVLDRYYDLYAELPIQETLTQIVQSDGYRAMEDDRTKAALISSIISEFRAAAKAQLIAGEPHITQDAVARIQRRVDGIAGFRTNRNKTSALYRWAHTIKE